ncbi:MAG TPA: glucose 1-dehydrogenase [Nevskiaceae bacterium]|nr:glucose 1-dehydrogenase [Nevskiaceae bacterium]
MRALTVVPGRADSVALQDRPDPPTNPGALRIRTLAIGICGTDREIAAGLYGEAPPDTTQLVLGHESIGHVIEAPRGSTFAVGDLVAGFVRRPDPVPCPSCAIGEWDMCRNGLYTERGIKRRDGYGAELVILDPAFAVAVPPSLGLLGVLTEPTSVLAKAWEQIERVGRRAGAFRPRRVLVTGAGPIGLLAALIGVQRGLEVHVFDRTEDGPKPGLVAALGAYYHAGAADSIAGLEPDIVVECTGASSVVLDVLCSTAPAGIVCLTGVSSGRREIRLDVDALNRSIVLENDLVFGSVNANRRHYEAAVRALEGADPAWLAQVISRRVPLERWPEAFERRPGDVKVVLEFAA